MTLSQGHFGQLPQELGVKELTELSHSKRWTTWDHMAAGYDNVRSGDVVYNACLQLSAETICRGPSRGIALDAGCGTGLATLRLSAHFDRVVAIDFSARSLGALSTKILHGERIDLVRADITRLPFPTGYFDAVLRANTLQHLYPADQIVAVEELRRVAQRGANVVISVHHYDKMKQRLGWKKEGKPGGDSQVDYIYRFTRDELAAIVRQSVGPLARILGVGFYRLARVPMLGRQVQGLVAHRVGRVMARLGHGHMLVAVARTNHV